MNDGGRRFLIAVIGIFIGLAWLLPVYEVPQWGFQASYSQNWLRYMRGLAPLSIILLSSFYWPRRQFQSLNGCLALSFFILIPLICYTFVLHTSYLIYGVLPLIVSGITLIFSASLRPATLRRLAFWVGLVALIMIITAIVRFGMNPHSFYGRLRVHYGFSHPVDSACALVAATYTLARIVNFFFRRTPIIHFLFNVFLIVGLFYLLTLAASRNLGLLVIASIGTWAIVKYLPQVSWLHRGVFFAFAAVFSFYLYAPLFLDHDSAFYRAFDKVTSYRLASNTSVYNSFSETSSIEHLFGEVASEAAMPLHYRQRFSAVDSVQLSVLSNYGAVALITLQVWLLWVGWLAFNQRDPLRCAAWAAFFVGISFDSQGLTTSNLFLFFALCLVFRYPSALTERQLKPARIA